MKTINRILAAAAATVLAAQPVVAAQSAQRLSLSGVTKADARVSQKSGKAKAAAGIPLVFIILGVVVVIGVIAIAADGNSSSP